MSRPSPGTAGYEQYIRSPEWQERREAKLQQAGHRCQGCGTDERLEVHHLSYALLGRERLEELMVLCHFCHAREHGRASTGVGPIAGRTQDDLTATARGRDRVRNLRRVAVACGLTEMVLASSTTGRERKRARAALNQLYAVQREWTGRS